MGPPTDAAVRSALSSICARCSTTLGTRGRHANGLVQASHRSLHTPARSRSQLLRPTNTTLSSSPAPAPIGRLPGESRPITGLLRKLFGGGEAAVEPAQDTPETPETKAKKPQVNTIRQKRVLREDNLFHLFSKSPIPEIRKRAAYIREHASCPHPEHRKRHALPQRVNFECPDCGIPVYCSKEHWATHFEEHLKICDTLRQINEDDHDLRSGRWFPEFEYAGPQVDDSLVNMTNWDTFLYTRAFEAINSDRSMRQATRLLTYPITIASVLHELSPHNTNDKGRLTTEGLKSFSALRYTLHPPPSGGGTDIKGLRPEAPPVRLFILGARAESSLPRDAWVQLAHLFPGSRFHLIFIGPESMTNRNDEFPLPERTGRNPFGAVVEDRVWPTMKISTIVDYYHTIHKTRYFAPYDPYFDCFVMFHPGLGHPASAHEWEETIPMLLETKVPILATGYTQEDMQRDIDHLGRTVPGEFDILLKPGENVFRSLRWDLNDMDPQDISAGNWGTWAFRGKRYEAAKRR